jgi:nitroimidazol reductase NimA-like FMN-containing flavoprotein (pyridoxamine 5'-phosphate oxidase superfamily)
MIGELHDIEMEEVLRQNVLGRLGCTDGTTVYVVPVNYVYHNNYIISHSAEGKKIRIMRSNPNVCFEVDEMEDMKNWRSVVTWGKYEEITDELEKQELLELLVDRMMQLKVSSSALPPHAFAERQRIYPAGQIPVVIWRIAVNKKTGRFEKNP